MCSVVVYLRHMIDKLITAIRVKLDDKLSAVYWAEAEEQSRSSGESLAFSAYAALAQFVNVKHSPRVNLRPDFTEAVLCPDCGQVPSYGRSCPFCGTPDLPLLSTYGSKTKEVILRHIRFKRGEEFKNKKH